MIALSGGMELAEPGGAVITECLHLAGNDDAGLIRYSGGGARPVYPSFCLVL